MKKEVTLNKIILLRNLQTLKFKKKVNFFKYKVLLKMKNSLKYRKTIRIKDNNLWIN